jgi:exonuclease SbcD
MARPLRLLLLADTHLGFDFPVRPRVERRRRGEDFFANTRAALAPALRGEVDFVVHAGDLFFRSRVPPRIVTLAFDLLLEVAERTPLFLVPGNHERSVLPRSLLLAHRNVHIFDAPKTHRLELEGVTLALSGFPCAAEVRRELPTLLERTGWRERSADVRLLCLHQAVEGARVGPVDFTFRDGNDVVRRSDLPPGFAAVLAGHVHRFQILDRDRSGRPLPPPVFVPGSVERTSFAERNEPKGALLLEVEPGGGAGGRVVHWEFRELPARPMFDLEIDADTVPPARIEEEVRSALSRLDPDGVIRLRFSGRAALEAMSGLSSSRLRFLALPTQTVELAWRGADLRIPPSGGPGV